jgi:hypothetical protein
MTSEKRLRPSSRRTFVKQLGAAAGAVAASSGMIGASPMVEAPLQLPGLPEPASRSVFPTLNKRTLGWLRFLWEKATTEDDWTSNGVPHPWWDRYTAPVVLSYGRFDLAYSSYALLLMADQTPAWREAYTRIADGLASRYPTYWGAIDWLTQIGDDPKRANYPPRVMSGLPEPLRGKYNRIGWTANGVAPWGLQPDPIGADGNLFFRGWFNLLLSIYKYVSGDDKWERPFKVTGYGDQEFEWDHHRIAEQLERQYRAHPEGPHCENTKIWFFCNSAAGLGLYLYDKVYGRQTHRAVQNFLAYAKKNYMGVAKDGKLEWITSYYDPIANHKSNGGPGGGISTAFMVLPQDRELAAFIYEAAANAAGWNNPRVPARASSTALLMARELGDHTAVARLSAAAEREYEPRFFGERDEKFGWWFRLNEGYPRGQQSATMMVSEVGNGGDWLRAFEAPHMNKFKAPTVEGIDFPALGVYQAWNDVASGTLYVGTYAASPDRQGAETSWRVTNLPNTGDVVVLCDGEPFKRFEVTGANAIRIDTTIDNRRYEIFTGYRGTAKPANQAQRPERTERIAAAVGAAQPTAAGVDAASRASSDFFPAGGPGCPCCQA